MIADSSRLKGWERKLLDLSLRNSMINLKPTKTLVPLSENNISSIYTRLKSNTLSEIIGPLGKENTELLKSLYRGARTSIEENGANSLFVAIGTLRWFDVDDPRQHHAPLIFIPVSIVRKKAMTYEVRLWDDEPMINVTLIEMLRQMFGVTFPDLSSLPELESGLPDWQRIFILFKEQIEEINKHSAPEKEWKLLDDSYIGIFSFTKFLMWHNVHFHPEVIEQHRILHGFINNQYNSEEDITQAKVRDIEGSSPLDLMLPINYDSSQLEAVAECSLGRSFVLHGPPGTGKSQTITNMIANSIYQGKRVLFVAEKKAALEVVRARLNAIGLEPYCLELHSNKTDKHSFFSQVASSKINQIGTKRPTPPFPTNYKEKAPILSASLLRLRQIEDALHLTDNAGISLYESINNTLAQGYSDLTVSFHEIKHLSPANIAELSCELRALDLVVEIMGYHPGCSVLVGLYPKENTAENQQGVTETLRRMPERIARARKKAHSLLNRWIFKRTPEEILGKDKEWRRLSEIASIDAEKQTDLNVLESHINRWITSLEELRTWYHFSERAKVIRRYQFPSALNYFLEGKRGDKTADAVERAYYSALSYYAIDTNSALRGFNGKLHEESLDRYRRNDAEFQALRNKELVKKC